MWMGCDLAAKLGIAESARRVRARAAARRGTRRGYLARPHRAPHCAASAGRVNDRHADEQWAGDDGFPGARLMEEPVRICDRSSNDPEAQKGHDDEGPESLLRVARSARVDAA